MTKKDIVLYLVLALMFFFGGYLGGFPGGFMTGSASMIIFFYTVGKRLTDKVITRIDKQVKDILINEKENS